MRVCYFFSLSIVFAGILSWLLPMIDNLTVVYPNILMIEGIKQQHDPPLYSALIKTLQSFDNKPKKSKPNEQPLYDESSYAIPVISASGNLGIFLIRSELSSSNIADPYITDVKLLERPVDDLFTPSIGTWKEVWRSLIEGRVYLVSSSKNLGDFIIVYEVKTPQSTSHILRYYPERTQADYFEYLLPGSSSIMTLSIYGDYIVYAVEGGFYTYHFLQKTLGPEGEVRGWHEISTGALQNRKEFGMSEITGLKLLNLNNTMYMLKCLVTANLWQTQAKLSVEVLEFNSTDWNSMGELYTLNLGDYLSASTIHSPEELKIITRIRVSSQDSIYMGHYGMVLMHIRIL